MPDDMLLVTGDAPGARGFRLDGYGVFFDVEVPGVRPSLAWSLRTMNETASMFARELSQVRAQLRQAVNDPRQQQEMDRVLARIQAQMAPGSQAAAAAGGGRWSRVGGQHRHRAIARRVAGVLRPVGSPGRRRDHHAGVAGGSALHQGPVSTLEPGEVFTKAVAGALIDAMLENSGSLIIAPDEWLTVAARDNAQGNRFVASDPSDVMTIVLRVRGSDLADFQARRITPDEVRKRVEVRAF